MVESGFEVVFYDMKDGSKPARDFILGLLPKMRAKMFRLIDMLETNGPELREPYSKHLEDGIFELRGKLVQIYPVSSTSL